MSGQHGHNHASLGHHPSPADYGHAFAIGIALNLFFVVIEVGYGFYANSVALISDAGHNLFDVLGLAIAWAGARLSRRPADKRFTWGLRSSSILAALVNALLLMIALGAIAFEAIRRLFDPQPVAGMTMIVVAGIGIIINMGTALLFFGGRKTDINIRGAWLHMVADAGVSTAVVVAGLAILWTGVDMIDPAISLAIAGLIFWQTWGLLRDSVVMALGAVPDAIDYDAVADMLAKQPGVVRVRDLHIWPMSTTETALTAHLVMPHWRPDDGFLAALSHDLLEQFRIEHVTVQIESEGLARPACDL